MQAAEARAALVGRVALPPPRGSGAFSSKAAAGAMAGLLARTGASRSDVVTLVRQIPAFQP
jgi:hypothetical protein